VGVKLDKDGKICGGGLSVYQKKAEFYYFWENFELVKIIPVN